MKPKLVTAQQAAAVLHDAHQAVLHSDSMEGSVRWEYVSGAAGTDEETFAVQAAYRVGNSMGQGGMCLLGDTSGPQPAEPWGPLQALHKAVVAHQQCRDCGGTGVLRRAGAPAGAAGSGMGRPEECFCMAVLAGAVAAAGKALQQQQAYLAEMQALGVDTAC